mgnify:CR=1 FL=1
MQEDPGRENIPISTLVNFNDKILDEYGQGDAAAAGGKGRMNTAASSARPKSGKRPKSAKKKKN